MIRKYILIISCCFTLAAMAQENTPVLVSKRVVNRLYMNVFNNSARKIYEASIRGNLNIYKDELLEKGMSKSEFLKLAQYKEKISVEVTRDGKSVAADSFYYVSNTFEWIWGFKRLNTGHFALYMQKPKESIKGAGELVGYINQLDLKNLLGAFEWKMLLDITSQGKLGDKQHFVDEYWKVFNGFKTKFWEATMANKAMAFQGADLKVKNNVEELKSAFQVTTMVTVIQDSTHLEYNYQKAEYTPFQPDSIAGFAFSTMVTVDMPTATQIVKPFSMAPLFDPTYSGPDAYFLDPMYWISYSDALKFLKPEEVSFISEIIYLSVAEKLSNDCVY